MSQTNNNSNSYNNFKTAIFADCLANSQEIFQLIDEVFPIDSCRHYQIMPLKIVKNDLTLGMLDPANEESLKFVNSVARVFKYNLQIQLIDEQTFQIILASYPQNSPQSKSNGDRNQTVVDDNFNPNIAFKTNNSKKQLDSASTIVSELVSAPKSPEESERKIQTNKDLAATLFEIPPEFLSPKSQPNNLNDRPTIVGEDPAKLLAVENSEMEIAQAQAQISDLIEDIAFNKDFLPELLPELSWKKLLERGFKHQTEQINLTRYSDHAKIIAIQNKLSQSKVEVSLSIFDALTDEIKRIAKQTNTSTTAQKVVLERFYEQERILLRFEFVSPQPEETIKIQILRGKTLKIYEQQQMNLASDRALKLAIQLEKTLRRIQVCFDSAELNNLKELQKIQSRINHQLRLLDK